eukprot:g313.t1
MRDVYARVQGGRLYQEDEATCSVRLERDAVRRWLKSSSSSTSSNDKNRKNDNDTSSTSAPSSLSASSSVPKIDAKDDQRKTTGERANVLGSAVGESGRGRKKTDNKADAPHHHHAVDVSFVSNPLPSTTSPTSSSSSKTSGSSSTSPHATTTSTGVFSQAAFFGVFDGHNGNGTSKMLSERLHVVVAEEIATRAAQHATTVAPTGTSSVSSHIATSSTLDASDVSNETRIVSEALVKSFERVDSEFLSNLRDTGTEDTSGSTACCVVVSKRNVYCANAGDSRAVLCRGGRTIPLSHDHKAATPNERRRIEASGGQIRSGRVMGVIATARGFGDIEYKRTVQGGKVYWDKPFEADLITARPEIIVEAIRPEDEFIVIASDGVWDAMPSSDCAVNFIRRQLKETQNVDVSARRLVEYSAKRMGKRSDNCTAVVVLLNVLCDAE